MLEVYSVFFNSFLLDGSTSKSRSRIGWCSITYLFFISQCSIILALWLVGTRHITPFHWSYHSKMPIYIGHLSTIHYFHWLLYDISRIFIGQLPLYLAFSLASRQRIPASDWPPLDDASLNPTVNNRSRGKYYPRALMGWKNTNKREYMTYFITQLIGNN